MASASEPSTGIKPITAPIRGFLPREATACENAPMGPERVARPKAISPITPEKPMTNTNRKYGSKKEPPPNFDTRVGNIQMLPIPTAEPMQARINPQRLANASREWCFFKILHLFFPRKVVRVLLLWYAKSGVLSIIRLPHLAAARIARKRKTLQLVKNYEPHIIERRNN